MSEDSGSKILRWGVGALALIAFGLGIWTAVWWDTQTAKQNGPAQTEGGYIYSPGRPVTVDGLIDHNSQPFTLDQWRGHWLLINFGYLSCPDVCPVTLSVMNEVLYPKSQSANQKGLPDLLKVLYVTADPARDTPERMKEYLSYFGDRYLGITGAEEKLAALGRQVNAVFVSQKTGENDENYTVSHSSSLALINPQGEFVAMLKGPDSPAQFSQFLQEMLP
jgi:protein SCO1/2